MKNHYFSRITSVLLAVFVAFGMLFIYTGNVNAADVWELGLPVDNLYAGMEGYNVWVSSYNEESGESVDATVTSVKSSNSKVIKVHKNKYDGDTWFSADFKKVGKSTLTIKYKKPDGSSSTMKKTLTVKKYPNQIKSLKVNGKKVKVSANKYGFYVEKCKKTSVKVKVSLKKGWKVDKYVYANAYNSKTGKDKEIKIKASNITKGKAIKFPKGYDSLNVNFEMVKGNKRVPYYVGFFR